MAGALRWQVPSQDSTARAVEGVGVDAGVVYVTLERAGVSVLGAGDGSLRSQYLADRQEEWFVWIVRVQERVVCFNSVFQRPSSIEVVRAGDGVSHWQHAFSVGSYPMAVMG